MSQRTLEAAWRFLFPDGQARAGFSIRLGSGEPLLAGSALRSLDRLVAQSGGSTTEYRPAIFLTTNGTLVGDQAIDWLISSGWHVKLSLDGPQHIHDRWRLTRDGRGTFAQVTKAVAELAYRIPERFSVTAVLCRGADPQEVFEFIASLGVRRIELVPVAHQDESVLPGPDDVSRYERFVMAYARRHLESPQGEDIPTLVRFETRVVRVMGYDLQRISCGAGRSFFGIGPNGGIYPCFRFVGVESYRMGQLSTGLDVQATTAFQCGPGRPYDRRRPCHDCWAAPLCGGPCFACAEMFGPGGGQPLDLHCEYVLADARAAVWLVRHLRQHAPERLLSFLPQVNALAELI